MEKKRLVNISLVIGIPVIMLVILIGAVLPVAANPSDKWAQCANGKIGEDPKCEGSGNTGWVSGKVGGNKANYRIGDFIAYRAHRTGLTPNMRYCSGAWWDVAKAALPAIDYIGTFSETIRDANPLYNTGIPTTTVPTREPLPPDPILQEQYYLGGSSGIFTGTLPYGDKAITGSQGVLTVWGGTDINIKGYALNNPPATPVDAELSNGSQSFEVCFTATMSEVVAAWGGHIAIPSEWQAPDRPTGSPYHMKTGTMPNFFTAPRTSENDLAEFEYNVAPDFCDDYGTCPSANHYTVGSQDLQLGIDEETAITLESVSAGDGNDGLTLALIGVGVAALVSAMFILFRRQRADAA